MLNVCRTVPQSHTPRRVANKFAQLCIVGFMKLRLCVVLRAHLGGLMLRKCEIDYPNGPAWTFPAA